MGNIQFLKKYRNSYQSEEESDSEEDLQIQNNKNHKILKSVKGIKLEFDPRTGKIIGAPKEWLNNKQIALQLNFDESNTMDDIPQNLKPELKEFNDDQIEFINMTNQRISEPQNFQHLYHAEIDPYSNCGIRGLPMQIYDGLTGLESAA